RARRSLSVCAFPFRSPAPRPCLRSRPRRPLNLLVAKDKPINQLVIKITLEQRAGWRSRHGTKRPRCSAGGQSQRFDVLLMDVHMPDMDGFAATSSIREREKLGEHLPIIALTADATCGDSEWRLAVGMDD